jgi:hypothetical protein
LSIAGFSGGAPVPTSARRYRSRASASPGGGLTRVGATATTAACACSLYPRRVLGRVTGRSLTRRETFLAASNRAGRLTRGLRIACVGAPSAADRIAALAGRSGGEARVGGLVLAEASARGTSVAGTAVAAPLQQLPEASFGVGSGAAGAAGAASTLETVSEVGIETETSTLAVDTETSTVPTCTFTETTGMLTVTETAIVGMVAVAGGCGSSAARAVSTCRASTSTQTATSRPKPVVIGPGTLPFDSVQGRPIHASPQQRRPHPAKFSPPSLLVSKVAESVVEVNETAENLPVGRANSPGTRTRGHRRPVEEPRRWL